MAVDPKEVAVAALRVAYFAESSATIKIDVGGWNSHQVTSLLDALLAELADHKLRLKGVRTDTSGFNKLNITKDTGNSGMYKNVPVVMTPEVDFDVMEFVLQPRH